MPPIDITAKVNNGLPRNTAVLYKRTAKPEDRDPPAYLGVLRLVDGQMFWAAIWARVVRGKPAVELRLIPKRE